MNVPIISVSVIVPSYNGAHKLPNILEALKNQTIQDFETILVIDGSTDNTREVLESRDWGLQNLRVIHRENGGRSIARNSGVKEAKSDLLIFFDDDMRPTPECLTQHINHHSNYPDSILVGSQLEDFEKVSTDFQTFKAKLSRTWAPFEKFGKVSPDKPFITAANFSLPRQLFTTLAGFDERLTDAEDFDLAVKAVMAQVSIFYNNEALAWHDDFVTCQSLIKRHRQYHQSHLTLLQLKPEVYNQYNHYNPVKIGLLKKSIYWFFAQKFWIWSIDKFNWLRILPTKIRFKIYNVVVTSYSVYFTSKKL